MKGKIDIITAIVVVFFIALIELLEIILTFIPVVGDIAKWFINIAVWIPIQLWLKIKGARGSYYAIASLFEFIPIFNAVPTKTIILIITIHLHNKAFK